ncbi:hypothetical protein L0337_14735, partial [candidate division KSB1 bacterium]|nr:hypothetical protein [candidate division KSB1 bacterium]
MNKPTALPGQQGIYPDVLGALTNGARVNFDVIQVAVAAQPDKINAGKSFDVIVLLQSTVKSEVDVAVRLIVPEKDISGKSGRFATKLVKPILIGLRAGEVGYVHLPIQVGPQATPGEKYMLELEIQIQKKSKELIRIRDANGGTHFSLAKDLEHKQQQAFEGIRHLKFWAQTNGQPSNKVTLQLPFSVLPSAPIGLQPELKPGYKTLWTEAEYYEQQAAPNRDEVQMAVLLPKLNRQSVFFPLLKFTQARFEAAGYRLWA